jgi:hypothetical protein
MLAGVRGRGETGFYRQFGDLQLDLVIVVGECSAASVGLCLGAPVGRAGPTGGLGLRPVLAERAPAVVGGLWSQISRAGYVVTWRGPGPSMTGVTWSC